MSHYKNRLHKVTKTILSLCGVSGIYLLNKPSISLSQVIPDNSLGSENSVVNSIEEQLQNIEGGAIRGINLFHSFSEFSIPESNSVYFVNPDGISNIIGRVTGNNLSQILGTLGVLGEANLFLINPNGIVFGENASLDIRGSFIGSTASSVIFSEGQEFSAINPEAPPLLVINMPIGLGFTDTPQNIVNRAELIVDSGQTLALIGGGISLETGGLIAEGGKIELGSVAGNSVILSVTEQGFEFNYQEVNNFLDINLLNTAFIDTSGESGGDIHIQGRNLTVTDDAGIFATTFGSENGGTISIRTSDSVEFSGFAGLFTATEGEGSAANINIETQKFIVAEGAIVASDVCFQLGDCAIGKGGNLTVIASELVELSGLGLFTTTEASGNAGDITVATKKLTLTDGANIFSSSSIESNGQAGNINIGASESVNLVGVIETEDGLFPSGIFSQANTSNGGNITIETGKLIARDGAIVDASTFGTGDAGNLTIIASDSVELIGTAGKADFLSGLFAQVAIFAPEDAGNAGNLTIETGKLIIEDGAQIANTARFGGNGGELTINASEFILLNGTAPDATELKGSSGIFVSADSVAVDNDSISPIGDAGRLNITTGTLTVEDGAKISADNFGTGKGGTASFNVGNLIIRDGGLVRAGAFGEGGGGALTVNATESVEVMGTGTIGDTAVNSTLFTQAEGTGDAGNLNINTPTLIVKDGGEITASTLDAGKGGELDITAQQLTVSNGGTITARTSGTGDAGNIILKIADNVTLSDRDSGLFANTEAGSTGDGGSILTREQTPQTVIVRDGATMAVNSDGSGKGGSIEITAENLALNQASITAETASSQGGNITLNVGDTLSFDNSGKITATAGTAQAGGDGGNIKINGDFILAFPTDNIYEITANAFEGDGGNIQITTNSFFGGEFVDISASSELGLDGDVTIDVLEINPARGLTELPTTIVDASRLIAKSCLAGDEENEFVVTGRGGLPANPNESLRGDAVLSAEWVNLPQEGEAEKAHWRNKPTNPSISQEIVEARGWIIGANGNVILTANPTTTTTGEMPWLIPHSCTR